MYRDDTARTIVYHFENGRAVSFSGTDACGEDDDYNDTVQIMQQFKKKCNTNVFITGYSGKTIKEKFERIGSDVGDVAERIIEKYHKWGERLVKSFRSPKWEIKSPRNNFMNGDTV